MFPTLSLKFCWILSPHDVSETMQVVEDLVPQVLHGMVKPLFCWQLMAVWLKRETVAVYMHRVNFTDQTVFPSPT